MKVHCKSGGSSHIKCKGFAAASVNSASTSTNISCDIFGFKQEEPPKPTPLKSYSASGKNSSTNTEETYFIENGTVLDNINYNFYSYYYATGTLKIYAGIDGQQELVLLRSVTNSYDTLAHTYIGYVILDEYLTKSQIEKLNCIKIIGDIKTIASTSSNCSISVDIYGHTKENFENIQPEKICNLAATSGTNATIVNDSYIYMLKEGETPKYIDWYMYSYYYGRSSCIVTAGFNDGTTKTIFSKSLAASSNPIKVARSGKIYLSVELTESELNKLSYIKCDSIANSSVSSTSTTSRIDCNLYGYNKGTAQQPNDNYSLSVTNNKTKTETNIYENAKYIDYNIYAYYYGVANVKFYATLDDNTEILLKEISIGNNTTRNYSNGRICASEFLSTDQLSKLKSLKIISSISSIASTSSTVNINYKIY